jgi:hypothetical protein
MLDDKKAVHPTGRNRDGKGTVGENPITVHPSDLVETYLGPAGESTPLEALMHQAETVADLFDRLGRDTSDVDLAYEILEALVRGCVNPNWPQCSPLMCPQLVSCGGGSCG